MDNLKLYDYYVTLDGLDTPLGIIKAGEIGNTSQNQDLIRFPNANGTGTIACKAEHVQNNTKLFLGLTLPEAVLYEQKRMKLEENQQNEKGKDNATL